MLGTYNAIDMLIYYFFLFLPHACPRIRTSFSLSPVCLAQALEVTRWLPWESVVAEVPLSSNNDTPYFGFQRRTLYYYFSPNVDTIPSELTTSLAMRHTCDRPG